MQKFILFNEYENRDNPKQPYQGFYCEIDLMNAYSKAFDKILDMVLSREDGRGFEYAVTRFFKKVHPAKYEKKLRGYRSLMREYVKGGNENEAGIVCEIDYDELSPKNKADFRKYCSRFENRMERLTIDDYDFEPRFHVSRGSDNLTEF